MNKIQKKLILDLRQFYKKCIPQRISDDCVAIGPARIFFTILTPNKIKVFFKDNFSKQFFTPWLERYAKQSR